VRGGLHDLRGGALRASINAACNCQRRRRDLRGALSDISGGQRRGSSRQSELALRLASFVRRAFDFIQPRRRGHARHTARAHT